MLSDQRVFTQPGSSEETVAFHPRITVDSVDAATRFSIEGLGLTTPPDFLLDRAIQEGELIEVLPEWQVEPIPVNVVWPFNVSIQSNAKRLINFLTENR